jgi:hypothetical protein
MTGGTRQGMRQWPQFVLTSGGAKTDAPDEGRVLSVQRRGANTEGREEHHHTQARRWAC